MSKLTDKQKLALAKKTLRILRKDAYMALDGRWDRSIDDSDNGFDAQITLIDQTLQTLKTGEPYGRSNAETKLNSN